MQKPKLFLPFLLLISLLLGCSSPSVAPDNDQLDPAIEQKIDDLLAQMTLAEKVGQMNQYNGTWDVTGPAPAGDNKLKYDQIRNGRVGSMLNVLSAEATLEAQKLAVENSRLKIPMLFGYDVIHGYKTIFPVPLGESASWDLEAIEQSARVAAIEASAAGLHWTFAPMIDIGRDARWGRVMEGAGEDTYLGSLIAAARVRGLQGDDLSANNTIAACAKHFASYGFAEGGRDYNTVDISEQTLRNVVLPPFEACLDAGVATVMNSFNETNGVPATGDAYLQRTILKGEWNFDGFVISDWGSIGEMIAHGYAKDKKHAAQLAVNAGSDMDMESRCYIEELDSLVLSGQVDERLLDDAVRRILRIKFRLGLFDDPYRYSNLEKENELLYSDEHRAIARDVAKKSIVLLKNENSLLPLQKNARSIAVIGPLAADKDAPLGSWRAQATPNSAVSVLEGIQAAVGPNTRVPHAKGCDLAVGERNFIQELNINQTDKSGFAAAAATARSAEVVVLVIGEDAFQSGEGRSQTDIGLAGVQEDLLKTIYAANQNLVVVLLNGRPLAIDWAAQNAPAIVEAWHLGSESGHAIADVLFGDYNPSGKLPMSFPKTTGQVPIYYNHKNTGRPTTPGGLVFWSHYTDAPNEPLYPFGYGLSYANFTYSDLKLSTNSISASDSIQVSVTLSNNSNRSGKETIQLYIRDLIGTTTRPVKELKDFQAVELAGGESKTVTFNLKADKLKYYTRAGKWEAEPGDFKVFVGGNSRDVLEADFTLK